MQVSTHINSPKTFTNHQLEYNSHPVNIGAQMNLHAIPTCKYPATKHPIHYPRNYTINVASDFATSINHTHLYNRIVVCEVGSPSLFGGVCPPPNVAVAVAVTLGLPTEKRVFGFVRRRR